MMNNTQTFSQLTREQKEAVGLLSIGTFLEYFDLMLYVHMAVLLNELFFPKTDPHTASLISAFAFCSTFVLRPVGALIFGWIGDNIGRKATVIITTFIMSISCIIMANLPTYGQIGITAAYIVTACRIIQGMSSMGEIIGAELYLTEITKPPVQYPIVALISFISSLGGTFALGLATIVTTFVLNWRYAFWFGAIIAIIGSVARVRLRETPEFADAKRRIHEKYEKIGIDKKGLELDQIYKTKVNIKTSLALFFMSCTWPLCFYFIYMHCANILKDTFHYTATQVLSHNFIVSIGTLLGSITWSYLSYYIYPLKIIRIRLTIFSILILFCLYLLDNNYINSGLELLFMQLFLTLFAVSELPANPILFKHLPVFSRFTYSSSAYAISRALMSIITAFGVVYLTKRFDHWGILIIMIPVFIGYIFGFLHFEKLEQRAGNYSGR